MEPFVHAIIPLAFLLALFPALDKKYMLSLIPIVWIIDLDSYIGVHRFTFHNIFFVLLMAGLVYLFWDKKAFFVALYYGFTHLFLDFAYPGPAWLYPLVPKTFYLVSTVHKDLGHWIVNFSFGSLTLEEYLAFLQTVGPMRYIGEVSVLFLSLFALLLLVRFRKKIFSFVKIF